jgi:hypothetical protein
VEVGGFVVAHSGDTEWTASLARAPSGGYEIEL